MTKTRIYIYIIGPLKQPANSHQANLTVQERQWLNVLAVRPDKELLTTVSLLASRMTITTIEQHAINTNTFRTRLTLT